MAFEIAVERHAIAQQIANAIRSFVGNETGNLRIDDAAAGLDRVGCVLRRAVAFTDRSGNAALCPHARRAFTERRRGNHRDGQRRQFQRREKPGKTGTDDHDVAGTRLAFEGGEFLRGGVLGSCAHRIVSGAAFKS